MAGTVRLVVISPVYHGRLSGGCLSRGPSPAGAVAGSPAPRAGGAMGFKTPRSAVTLMMCMTSTCW